MQSLQRGHCVFTLSIPLPVLMSAPCQAQLAVERVALAETSRIAIIAVGQHAVRADESIPVPTCTCPHAGESILVQKWNSPQGGQVHYADIQMLLRGAGGIKAVFSYLFCLLHLPFIWTTSVNFGSNTLKVHCITFYFKLIIAFVHWYPRLHCSTSYLRRILFLNGNGNGNENISNAPPTVDRRRIT